MRFYFLSLHLLAGAAAQPSPQSALPKEQQAGFSAERNVRCMWTAEAVYNCGCCVAHWSPTDRQHLMLHPMVGTQQLDGEAVASVKVQTVGPYKPRLHCDPVTGKVQCVCEATGGALTKVAFGSSAAARLESERARDHAEDALEAAAVVHTPVARMVAAMASRLTGSAIMMFEQCRPARLKVLLAAVQIMALWVKSSPSVP